MFSVIQKQLQGQLNQLKANPVQFLVQRQFNIPQNMTGSPQQMIEAITQQNIPSEYINDPKGYLNYLMSSNQIPQAQQQQMLNTFGMFM